MALYKPNPDFASDFNKSEEALALVGELANTAADLAKADARRRTGNLADSIEAVAGLVDGVATGRVNANDFKAHWWEFGTRRHPADPYLRPAATAVTGRPVVGGDK